MSAYRDEVIKALFARASNHGDGESKVSRESTLLSLLSPPLVSSAASAETRFQRILDGVSSKHNDVGVLKVPATAEQFDQQRSCDIAEGALHHSANKSLVFQFDWMGTPKQRRGSETHVGSPYSSLDDNVTIMTLEELNIMTNSLVATPGGGNEVAAIVNPTKTVTLSPEPSCDTSTTSDMTEWQYSPLAKKSESPSTLVVDADKLVEHFKMIAASNPMLAKRIAMAANNALSGESTVKGAVVEDIVLPGNLFESHLVFDDGFITGSSHNMDQVWTRAKSPTLRERERTSEATLDEAQLNPKSLKLLERNVEPSSDGVRLRAKSPSLRRRTVEEPKSPSLRLRRHTTEPTSNEPSPKSQTPSELTLKSTSEESKSRPNSPTRGEGAREPTADDNQSRAKSPSLRLRSRSGDPASEAPKTRPKSRMRRERERTPEPTSEKVRSKAKPPTVREAQSRAKSSGPRRCERTNEPGVIDYTPKTSRLRGGGRTKKHPEDDYPATTMTSTLRRYSLTSSEVSTPQPKGRTSKATPTEEAPALREPEWATRAPVEEPKPPSKDPPGMKLQKSESIYGSLLPATDDPTKTPKASRKSASHDKTKPVTEHAVNTARSRKTKSSSGCIKIDNGHVYRVEGSRMTPM